MAPRKKTIAAAALETSLILGLFACTSAKAQEDRGASDNRASSGGIRATPSSNGLREGYATGKIHGRIVIDPKTGGLKILGDTSFSGSMAIQDPNVGRSLWIESGMTKEQVLKEAHKIGIQVEPQSSDRWIVGNKGLIFVDDALWGIFDP